MVSTVGVVVCPNWVRGWFIVQTWALRAFRFTLDPTRVQEEVLLRHADAARWTFNQALGMKVAAQQEWRAGVQADRPAPSGMTPLFPRTWCAGC
ncbi:helix-turn-helix domain-containing protein [Streptomyces sp. NPDC057291]|uniref:helix-turn-helix domain-containing protein n=1 Tax=Streptomyces sp. NPDC057291 TaxID=3346087 RepID=UPI003644B759